LSKMRNKTCMSVGRMVCFYFESGSEAPSWWRASCVLGSPILERMIRSNMSEQFSFSFSLSFFFFSLSLGAAHTYGVEWHIVPRDKEVVLTLFNWQLFLFFFCFFFLENEQGSLLSSFPFWIW
jgi:hypothetical protein